MWRAEGGFNPQMAFEVSTLATHYQERGVTVCASGPNLAKN